MYVCQRQELQVPIHRRVCKCIAVQSQWHTVQQRGEKSYHHLQQVDESCL